MFYLIMWNPSHPLKCCHFMFFVWHTGCIKYTPPLNRISITVHRQCSGFKAPYRGPKVCLNGLVYCDRNVWMAYTDIRRICNNDHTFSSQLLLYIDIPPDLYSTIMYHSINTLRPRQNRCHFADDIFTCIFLNETVLIPIKISLKIVPQGPINNIPALVQIMAWCRSGDKPLSEPVMVSLLTHNYMRHSTLLS